MQRIESGLSGMVVAIGTLAGIISSCFGGWDNGLIALMIFMGIDYLTGLMLSGVFKGSPNTKSGALQSGECFKGLCRKGMTLFIVLMSYQLDLVAGTNFIRNATIFSYIIYETISTIENLGLMGVYVPPSIQKGIDALKNKEADE